MLNPLTLVPHTPLHQCVDEAGVIHRIRHPSPAIVLSNETTSQFWLLLMICKGISSSLLGLFIVNLCDSYFPLIIVSPFRFTITLFVASDALITYYQKTHLLAMCYLFHLVKIEAMTHCLQSLDEMMSVSKTQYELLSS